MNLVHLNFVKFNQDTKINKVMDNVELIYVFSTSSETMKRA